MVPTGVLWQRDALEWFQGGVEGGVPGCNRAPSGRCWESLLAPELAQGEIEEGYVRGHRWMEREAKVWERSKLGRRGEQLRRGGRRHDT